MPSIVIPGMVAAYAGTILWLVITASRRVSAFTVSIGVLALLGVAGGVALYIWRSPWPMRAVKTFLYATAASGLALLAVRIAFVMKHHGMEGPEGYGSPLAFLLGFASEQAVLTIPAVLLLLGLRSKAVPSRS